MPQDSGNGSVPGQSTTTLEIDGHGRAALLLVESLIHSLASRSILTLEEAVELIEVAADVECELARAANGHDHDADSASLLLPIAKSIRIDLGE